MVIFLMLFLIFPIACQFRPVSTQSPSSQTMLGDMGLHEPQLGQELAKRAKLVEVETLRPRNPFRRCCLLSYNPQYVLAATKYSLLSKTWLRQQKHGFTSVVCSQINSLKEIDWLSRPWKNFSLCQEYLCPVGGPNLCMGKIALRRLLQIMVCAETVILLSFFDDAPGKIRS